MKTFEIEIIHEPTGTYMDFEVTVDDDDITEDNVFEYVLSDVSVIANLISED